MNLSKEQNHAMQNLIQNKDNNQIQTLGGYTGCG
jgi:hypothetical protein